MARVLFRKKPEPRRAAVTPQEWRALCQRAAEAAERALDPRAAGLRTALVTRREQVTLQTLSIICDNDIAREFPTKALIR